MPTKVLVFESDSGFAEELRSGLSRLDCSVTVVDDASAGLQTAARDRPDLILLAIELPRMNGFSVCNKLKRDPGLKDVPLIIMSSDSTEETFEQHRRLRTRAEDYVHKPLDFAALLARIQAFVPIGLGSTAPSSDEAIVIEDDLQIEEEEAEEVTEADLDLETDQVFNSIVSVPPPGSGGDLGIEFTDAEVLSQRPPSMVPMADPEVVDDLEIAEAEVLPASLSAPPPRLSSQPPPLPSSQPPPLPSAPPARPLSEAPPSNGAAASLPPELSLPAASGPLLASSLPPRSQDAETQRMRDDLERLRTRNAQLEEELRGAQLKTTELEDAVRRGANKENEVTALQREVDDLKARLSAGVSKAGGSAREFLDLREQLNRKDKELLDLRDQLTHRDKELLAVKDSALEHERQKADLSDKVFELDKQVTELSRTGEALKNDKEAASKRADDFKRKADKFKTELDQKTTESAELKTQLDAEIIARSTREQELEARAQADLEKAVMATEASERERAEQALTAARGEAEAALTAALDGERQSAAAALTQALSARESELVERHAAQVSALERGGEETLRRLRAEHEQAIADAETGKQSALSELRSELDGQRQRELDAQRTQLEAAAAEREAAQTTLINDRNQTVGNLERDLAARTGERDTARRDVEKRNLRIEGLETDISMTREGLESTRASLLERETSLNSARAELAEKVKTSEEQRVRLATAEARLLELEAKLTTLTSDYEQTRDALNRDRETLSRARSKWEGDRASLERTKDALAAALAQVDEIEARTLE